MIFSSVDLPDPFAPMHADLRAVEKREPDVLEDDRVGRIDLAQPLHGVDELRHIETGNLIRVQRGTRAADRRRPVGGLRA